MAIKKYYITVLLILSAIASECSKKKDVCPKLGYEFAYLKPGVVYSPSTDSIPLGSSITIEASAPKKFFELEKGYDVILNQNTIFGPLVIKKATNDPSIPIIGAANDVTVFAYTGDIKRDSIQFSGEQLKIARTAYLTLEADSFKIKVDIRPNIKGIFFISLNQQSNRDNDCALYRYFLKIKSTDQHLHYLAQFNNGIIDEDGRNYLYCFKVY